LETKFGEYRQFLHQISLVTHVKFLYQTAVILVFALAGGQSFGTEKPPDVHEIARKVDRNYNNLKTLRAEFEESYAGAGISRVDSGVLWLKRPGKMLWDYRSPKEKVFIANGKSAWFYVVGEPQARRAKLEKIDDLRSPLRYLLGKTKLEKEFENLILLAPTPGAASFVLEGVPKMMRERVERVQLEITPQYDIQRIRIAEIGGAITEFRFSNSVENVAISEEKFRFNPPPGVHIMESTEMTP
jgi:outer membrane lipoprotein carrier protein